MDTLISLGVSAAYVWSVVALFFGDAGDSGMKMTFNLLPQRGGGLDETYLEVAAAVTVFILTGRYFEARAKRSAGAALRALLEFGAKDVCRAGRRPRWHRRAAHPHRPSSSRAPVSSSGPERRSRLTASWTRATRPSTRAC